MKRFLIFCLVFVPIYLVRLQRLPEYDLPTGREIVWQGTITSQPYLKDTKQIIQMGPILVVADRFPTYFYGQKVRVSGTLK